MFPLFATGVIDKFAAGINDTSGIGGNFATGVIDTRGRWCCTLTCKYLCEFSQKIWNDPNATIRGLGEDDSQKNQKQKISWHCLSKRGVLNNFIYIVESAAA